MNYHINQIEIKLQEAEKRGGEDFKKAWAYIEQEYARLKAKFEPKAKETPAAAVEAAPVTPDAPAVPATPAAATSVPAPTPPPAADSEAEENESDNKKEDWR